MRDEYLILLQKLTQVENTSVYKCIKECFNNKQNTHAELYQRFMEKERARSQQLVELVSSQQNEIAELKERLQRVLNPDLIIGNNIKREEKPKHCDVYLNNQTETRKEGNLIREENRK